MTRAGIFIALLQTGCGSMTVTHTDTHAPHLSPHPQASSNVTPSGSAFELSEPNNSTASPFRIWEVGHGYGNARFDRHELEPWVISTDGLHVTVRSNSYSEDFDDYLALTVDLKRQSVNEEAWKIVSIDSPTPTVEINSLAPSENPGEYQAKLDVSLPKRCEERELITIDVQTSTGGKVETHTIPIDYRCLMGDIVDGGTLEESADDLAHITEKYLYDSSISELVETAPSVPGTLEEEVQHIRKALKLDMSKHYKPDGFATYNGKMLVGIEPYAFSPNETVRFGGDCEDWAIFSAAYLTRRGFDAYIADSGFHAWTVVSNSDNTGYYKVDLTDPKAAIAITPIPNDPKIVGIAQVNRQAAPKNTAS